MNPYLISSLLLTFLAVMLWVKASARPRGAVLAAVLFFLSLLLSGAYLVADSLSGAGIDESVMFHLQAGIKGTAYSAFYKQFAVAGLFVFGGFLATVLVYKLSLVKAAQKPHWLRAYGAFLVIIAAFSINPASRDLLFLYKQSLYQSRDVPEGFIVVQPIAPDGRPKNFMILYLESIERTYFDESIFPGLMPHMKALEKEALSFTDITQARGTSWSIAGMAAGFCGVPLVGAAATNSMSGIDEFLPGATCLGDLLSAYGYRLEHLYGGDLDFAGWGTFFKTHGFDEVDGIETLEPLLPEGTQLGAWGLHDEDLMALATARYSELSAAGTPFGITLNTIDTHHPDGHPGPYCDGIIYGDGENGFLNTMHCADKMAAEFISGIRANPAFKDTVLVVASDHLAMPNEAWELLESTDNRRNLLMMFGTEIAPELNAKTGSSFDVGTTMLNEMGIPIEGIGFGRNLLSDVPSLVTAEPSLDDMILENGGFVTSLWSYPQLTNGVGVDIAARKLQLGDRAVSFPVLFTLNEDLGVSEANFDFYDGYPLPEKAGNLWYYERFFWVDSCENIRTIALVTPEGAEAFCMAEGILGGEEIKVAPVTNNEEISFAGIKAFFDTQTIDEERYNARLADIAQFAAFGVSGAYGARLDDTLIGKYVISSKGGYLLGDSVVRNVDTGDEVTLERGLSLIGVTGDGLPEILAYADTCAYETPVEDLPPLDTNFEAVIEDHADAYGAFLIVLHDSALCGRYEISPLFDGAELERWQEIGPRSSYIALMSGSGDIREYVGDRETATTLAVERFIAP